MRPATPPRNNGGSAQNTGSTAIIPAWATQRPASFVQGSPPCHAKNQPTEPKYRYDAPADVAATGAPVAIGPWSVSFTGGGPVSPVIVLPALIPVLMLARLLAKREMRVGVIVGVLVAGQVWVHTLSSLTGHHAATNNSLMLLGHAIATVVAVALLRRREAVAWANARRKAITAYIVTLLRSGAIVLPATPRLALAPSFANVTLPNCLVIGESVVLRGPPRWGIR